MPGNLESTEVLVHFESAREWEHHVRKMGHYAEFAPDAGDTARQLSVLCDLSKTRMIAPSAVLCAKTRWRLWKQPLKDHIAQHLHEFALESTSSSGRGQRRRRQKRPLCLAARRKQTFSRGLGTPRSRK